MCGPRGDLRVGRRRDRARWVTPFKRQRCKYIRIRRVHFTPEMCPFQPVLNFELQEVRIVFYFNAFGIGSKRNVIFTIQAIFPNLPKYV